MSTTDAARDTPRWRAVLARYETPIWVVAMVLLVGYRLPVITIVALDVGYQYMNSPNIETYSITAAGLTRHEGFDGHQVKVGLRYDLW